MEWLSIVRKPQRRNKWFNLQLDHNWQGNTRKESLPRGHSGIREAWTMQSGTHSPLLELCSMPTCSIHGRWTLSLSSQPPRPFLSPSLWILILQGIESLFCVSCGEELWFWWLIRRGLSRKLVLVRKTGTSWEKEFQHQTSLPERARVCVLHSLR